MPLGTKIGLVPGHIVTWDPAPPPKRGTAPNFRLTSIVAERSTISATAEQLLKIVMLCVVLCFNAYVVNKFHDNEHCSCSD